MKIEIRSHHFDLDENMTGQIKNQIHFALNRFGGEISRVLVRFADKNGPKGGPDKHCLVSVKLTSAGKIVAQGDGVDLLSTLNYCVECAGRGINRALERRRDTPIRMNRRQTGRAEEQPEEQTGSSTDA